MNNPHHRWNISITCRRNASEEHESQKAPWCSYNHASTSSVMSHEILQTRRDKKNKKLLVCIATAGRAGRRSNNTTRLWRFRKATYQSYTKVPPFDSSFAPTRTTKNNTRTVCPSLFSYYILPLSCRWVQPASCMLQQQWRTHTTQAKTHANVEIHNAGPS